MSLLTVEVKGAVSSFNFNRIKYQPLITVDNMKVKGHEEVINAGEKNLSHSQVLVYYKWSFKNMFVSVHHNVCTLHCGPTLGIPSKHHTIFTNICD